MLTDEQFDLPISQLKKIAQFDRDDLRQGSSLRAQFYRKKDELLDRNGFAKLAEIFKKKQRPDKYIEFCDTAMVVKPLMDQLDESPNDQSVYDQAIIGITTMAEQLNSLIKENG